MISIFNHNAANKSLILFLSLIISTNIIAMEEPLYQLTVDNSLLRSTIIVTQKTIKEDALCIEDFHVLPEHIQIFKSTYPLFTITVPGYNPPCFDIWVKKSYTKKDNLENITLYDSQRAPKNTKIIKIETKEKKPLATLYAINKKSHKKRTKKLTDKNSK